MALYAIEAYGFLEVDLIAIVFAVSLTIVHSQRKNE